MRVIDTVSVLEKKGQQLLLPELQHVFVQCIKWISPQLF